MCAEFRGKPFGSLMQSLRVFVQRLDRQPPSRAGNAQTPNDLIGEIENGNCGASEFLPDLAVIECNATATNLCNFIAQLLDGPDGFFVNTGNFFSLRKLSNCSGSKVESMIFPSAVQCNGRTFG